ncbi:MAG: helix-turn-helix domain-containing protein [Chthoniobacterales bacterium]
MFTASSKTDNPAGTRFAREPDFPFWTFSHISKGAIRVKCGKNSCILEAPKLVLVEANTPYQLEALSRTHETYAYFVPRAEIERLLNWPSPLPRIRALDLSEVEDMAPIIDALKDMFEFSKSPFPDRAIFAENAFERALLLAHRINPHQQYAQLDERITKIINFINNNHTVPLTLNQLAKEVHLSPSRFAHFFREQMGRSPMEYVEERRLHEAQQLLVATDKSIGDIALACGFENQFHFSTRFRKFTGKSPRDYRRSPLP